ncbi:MAG: sensor histidine kinase, partial [Burkholderiales bacterium]
QQDLSQEPWKSYLEKVARREPFRDLRYLRRDPNGDKWLTSSGIPLFAENGEFLGYRGIGSDVTERVRLEQKANAADKLLREAIDTFRDPVFITDAEECFVLVNKAFRDISVRGNEDLIGMPYEQFLREYVVRIGLPMGYKDLDEWVKKRLVERRQGSGYFERRRQDGTWLLISDHRLSDGTTISFAINVTERKRAEEKIHAALQEKEVLLKEIYHRVKNNLQVVASLLNLQSRGISDGVAKQLMNDSASRVKSIALVHEQLYRSSDLSKISLKQYLEQLTSHLQQMNRQIATQSRITLAIDPVELNIDMAIPIGLVVNELVSNAYRHAFAGRPLGGEICVRVTRLPREFICLEVEDDGCGLPEGFAPDNGSSLGLRLVVTLAQQLGGELEWGRGRSGARFAIQFPMGATQTASLAA